MSDEHVRPILFSGPMICALLEGHKTQTRRVLQARHLLRIRREDAEHYRGIIPDGSVRRCLEEVGMEGMLKLCPYGKPGDLLWVRETWMDLQGTGVEHRPTPDSSLQRYAYGAESPRGSNSDEARKDFGLKWRPSIHMPRTASRLTLRITEVRVERLQDISEADAMSEGAQTKTGVHVNEGGQVPGAVYWFGDNYPEATPWWAFRSLWKSINGLNSWDANPWVWAISFEVVQANVDQLLQLPRTVKGSR